MPHDVFADVSLRPAPADAIACLREEGFSPLAARVFAARGIRQRAEISPPIQDLPPPAQLAGAQQMAEALARVCASRAPLCIVGDYDADGVTSTTLAHDCLTRLGASVCWHIPSRYDSGYGLTPAIVEAQAAAGVRHLLTVDNGTTAHAALARARELGITTYVVDHHQPDDTPSGADYLVNPQVTHNGDDAEFRSLVGVGLTFYLMAALRSVMGADIRMADYLDLVAIGTVADCGEMGSINRTLTAGGLARLRAGKTRPGLRALASCSKIVLAMMGSRDIGFRLAPRINAAGRMGSADAAMQCLLATDATVSRVYAEQLETLNKKRLQQQEEVHADAMRMVDSARSGIVVGEAHWPSGIVGIIAGKIAEDLRRPAFVLHRLPEGDWRGSGRAGSDVDLVAVLRAIAKAHPGMLFNYGGHSQAAGVHVKDGRVAAFAEAFDAACAAAAHAEQPADEKKETDSAAAAAQKKKPFPTQPLLVDALSPEEITPEALRELEDIPWGQGFAAPIFASQFEVRHTELTRGGFLRLHLACAGGHTYTAIYFSRSEWTEKQITTLYSAGISSYNNQMQFIIHSVLQSAAADK